MSFEKIEKDFREKVCSKIDLMSEGEQRYRVFTPFLFEDGDHLAIVLRRENGRWVLSDEGHTYMHLTYDIDEKDLLKGTRQKIITNALSSFHVEDVDGELVFTVKEDHFGDALYSFVQALLKITDIAYLSRERVRSTFMDDFQTLISENVPRERMAFNWHDNQHDPHGMYTVDCRINGMPKPLYIYGLQTDARTRDATIAILQFEKWGLSFKSLAIFEDQESINRKVLARFTDVGEKQFASLDLNRSRIIRYMTEAMQG